MRQKVTFKYVIKVKWRFVNKVFHNKCSNINFVMPVA